MDRLRFGARARRRARLKRALVVAWVASLAGTAFGMPSGIGLLEHLGAPVAGEGPLRSSQTVLSLVRWRRAPSETVVSVLRFRREAFEAYRAPRQPATATATPRTDEPTPAPEPEPTPPAPEPIAPAGSIADIVLAAATEFELDGGYLLDVARCESGLDPGADSPAGYHGLFQFDQATWAAHGYGSIYDPVAQARTAARLLAAGESSRWPNCA